MNKPVILTGLRANNDLHIGNYFGGLLPFIDMAREKSAAYQLNLFVPDLHSFTTPIDHSQLQMQITHNLKIFVAAGLPLDNDNIHIYRQSYVPAHSELTWILDCFTSFGEMNRMTQFKEKAHTDQTLTERKISKILAPIAQGKKQTLEMTEAHSIIRAFQDNTIFVQATVGLFSYPVLMAADILLYNASYIPVGDDQSQHLEFTRDIAERLNTRFGEVFVVPEPVKAQHEFFGADQGLRIKDLLDPSKKMAKSDETGKGVIFLSENPDSAAKKIMSATTDSYGEIQYDPKERAGISNLLQMLALLQKLPLADVTQKWQGKTSYGQLKQLLAAEVKNFLSNFQATLATTDQQMLEAKLVASEAAMNQQANATLANVQQAVGLRPKT
jgi:tryptophanyl-tRNA synthetase